MSDDIYIQSLPYDTDGGLGTRAKIGLIILQSDQTIEHEFAAILRGDDVAIYHARIPNAMEVTPETLRQMEVDMPVAAALLPAQFDFDVIGYCCTSGTSMIGEDRVHQILHKIHTGARTTNPLSACKAALRALGLTRIAMITPYSPAVTQEMRKSLNMSGISVNAVASFNEPDDFTVGRISQKSIQDAIAEIGARDDCDGVFVSCTNLRTLPFIAAAEAQLGKPVISSNQALAWHLMRLAGIEDAPKNSGQLFQKPLTQRT